MSPIAIMTIALAHAIPSPAPFSRTPVPRLANDVSDTIRVRVARVRTTDASLSGTDIAFNGQVRPGYHSYKLKKFKAADEHESWVITDRDLDWSSDQQGELQVSGRDLRLNLKSVPEQFEIKTGSANLSDVIATLDIETYLRGVLPSEMPASWPVEALKAQAVAARTFALFRKATSTHSDFDLDSDVMDQMFLNQAESTKFAEQAILETKGQTLRDKHGKIVAAYFHADCGGHTEDAHAVWGTEATGTTSDDRCPLNPRANWTLKLSLKELTQKLKSQIKTIMLGDHTPTGRISSVRLAFADGTTTTLTGNELRSALGFDHLRSTQFTLARDGDTYIFKGRGYGHGVGLCQWGARQMAKSGHTYKEILAHYYSKAILQTDPKAPPRDETSKQLATTSN